jgi:hypothetical protein
MPARLTECEDFNAENFPWVLPSAPLRRVAPPLSRVLCGTGWDITDVIPNTREARVRNLLASLLSRSSLSNTLQVNAWDREGHDFSRAALNSLRLRLQPLRRLPEACSRLTLKISSASGARRIEKAKPRAFARGFADTKHRSPNIIYIGIKRQKQKGGFAAALELKLEKHSGSHPLSVSRRPFSLSTETISFKRTLGIGPGETRTHILEGANLALYPVELRGQFTSHAQPSDPGLAPKILRVHDSFPHVISRISTENDVISEHG